MLNSFFKWTIYIYPSCHIYLIFIYKLVPNVKVWWKWESSYKDFRQMKSVRIQAGKVRKIIFKNILTFLRQFFSSLIFFSFVKWKKYVQMVSCNFDSTSSRTKATTSFTLKFNITILCQFSVITPMQEHILFYCCKFVMLTTYSF